MLYATKNFAFNPNISEIPETRKKKDYRHRPIAPRIDVLPRRATRGQARLVMTIPFLIAIDLFYVFLFLSAIKSHQLIGNNSLRSGQASSWNPKGTRISGADYLTKEGFVCCPNVLLTSDRFYPVCLFRMGIVGTKHRNYLCWNRF